MMEAIEHVPTDEWFHVAYIACNDSDDGLIAWYEDRKGNIESDYDYIVL